MTISATVVGQITCLETLDTGVDAASDPTLVQSGFNFSHRVDASTTITGTKMAADNQALTTGAYTLDLTAVAKTGGTTQSLTALKMRGYMFRNPSTNSGTITITVGASTGYVVGTNWKEVLAPGQQVVKWMDSAAPTIDATHKFLDVTGTGSETFDYFIIAG